ncbi:hypothetical protein BASA50_008577 [Batrachochytrium salamandrivorans]|uniref:Protein unc-45 homolog B n=1 Tax=Batrachochytrium salamandrivorans TaxID=1357716 RepID=A0ABQ8F3R4_9FUNG|nr:hypothetical protein BASA50_008577 [Batrachochytrium salamandrivorans]KAH6597307.1 hypothetical protein BASA61_003202 [Batrachochytrium salamandrivorans]KAH9264777.1 hypothetical protein BASA83_011745 [Batrachochytrium salamandrivorans]
MLMENLEAQIDDLTQRLSSAQLDPKLLIQRALAHEQLNQLDKAFVDLRAVLSDDSTNTEAKSALERVLHSIQERQAQSTDSLYDLVRIATGAEDSAQRLDAARHLASLSHEPKVCMHITEDHLFEQLVDAVSREPDDSLPKDISGPSSISLRLLLLHTISNVAAIPNAALSCTNCFLRGNGGGLSAFLGEGESVCVKVASDCVISAVTHAATLDSPDERLPISKATIVLRMFASRCSAEYNSNVQKASMASLIKASASQDLALCIFTLPEFALVLHHVANSNESFRMSVSALLAKCFEHIGPAMEATVLGAFSSTIMKCLTSNSKVEIHCGLLALAAVFDAQPQFGANLFKGDGILSLIMNIGKNATEDMKISICKALLSGCNDPTSRQMISNVCVPFLLDSHRQSQNQELRGVSSLSLIKLMSLNKTVEEELLRDGQTLTFFIDALRADSKPSSRDQVMAVEALSYLSIIPKVKDQIASNTEVLKLLIALCSKNRDRAFQYGVATILANITAYQKQLTEEQKQVQKLRDLANQQSNQPSSDTSTSASPNDDDAVAARTKLVASSGIFLILGALASSESINVRDAVSQTYLSVATDRDLRGLIIQHGGCRQLIGLATIGSKEGRATAAQALAKIAITSDPHLAFKGQMVYELVRPLISLCTGDTLLQQFEALMALTNIASVNDDVRARIIASDGIRAMENLQFLDHVMVRRAATEALCNMMYHPQVMEMYTSPGSSPRLKVMVALSDSEDFATRRAASGALAVLSSHPDAAIHIARQNRALTILIELAKEDSPELQHRAIETIKNITFASEDCTRKLMSEGVVEVLSNLIKGGANGISQVAAETLQLINQQSRG